MAPVQPENLATVAMHASAQVAAFGDGAPGWMLAAYVPADLGASDTPVGGWASVRVQVGANVRGVQVGANVRPMSLSRVGGGAAGGGGLTAPAMMPRPGRTLALLTPRALAPSPTPAPPTATIDEADGLGDKVVSLSRGDRLVVPAAKLGLEGLKVNGPMFGIGDLVLTVTESRHDDGFVLAEVSL